MQHSARYNMAIMRLLHAIRTRYIYIYIYICMYMDRNIEEVKAATVEHRAATQPRAAPAARRRAPHTTAQPRAAARGGTSIKQPAPRAARPAPGPPAGAQS